MRKYELIPTDGRKSFYGKAVVFERPDGSAVWWSSQPVERFPWVDFYLAKAA